MKYTSLFIAIPLAVLTFSCKDNASEKSTEPQINETVNRENPFLKKSTLPYQAPDFNAINNEDFQPAMEQGMKEQMKEIEVIANNSQAPTFENTLVAMEKSGQLLGRVYGTFGLLSSANTNDELQKIQEEEAPKMAAHKDAIYLNSKLFKRIKTLYEKRESLNLDAESKKLLEYYHEKFILAGANLSEEKKAELKSLNKEIATLNAQFSNKLIAAAKEGALVVDDKTKLKGLSDNEIETAAAAGKDGEFSLPLQNTTQQPALQSLEDREIRQTLFEHSWTRAEKGDENDTRKIISQIAEIRAKQAQLLGFKNYAAWKLQNQMAKTPEAVQEFLAKLVPAATKKAKQEAKEIQEIINKEGETFPLKAWDWNYYAEKLRKAKYNLDESEIKPYFELNTVLEKGVFYAANKLYGLNFKERKDIPVFQEDVRVFEITDANGSKVGLFYGDFFKRDNKSGGAWMGNFVDQSKLHNTKPVIYNVCNYTKPTKGQPALISFDEVTTLFHEFGHALHGFFANQQYPSISGTSTARDFVEFPSQFNEHWALYPSIFKNYAMHYKTGEPMPQELVEKIKKAATFNQGYALTELLAAAQLDMQWHTISTDEQIKSVNEFEKEALKRTNLDLEQVPPRYRSSYFKHIWSNGYAAGYYAYLWTDMLNHDAYAWFKDNGGLTRENGDRFRKMILSKGNTEDYKTMFKAFRGQDPDITPLLKARGLISE